MKQSLKLEKINKTGSGVEFANIICEMPYKGAYSDSIKVKLSCTSTAVRIISDHLLYEMKHICQNLDADKIREFAKDMIKANKTLREIRNI